MFLSEKKYNFCVGGVTRLQQLCRLQLYGQRVLVIEYKVNGEKKKNQLNENFLKEGQKAGIRSKVVLDLELEAAHKGVYNHLREEGLLIDNKTGYKVVDVVLLIETDPQKIIFREKDYRFYKKCNRKIARLTNGGR